MKRLFVATLALALLAGLAPARAAADYLYSMLPIERQPRVLFLVDNSSNLSAADLGKEMVAETARWRRIVTEQRITAE